MGISSLHGAKLPRQYSSYKDVLKEQLELTLKLKPKDIILFLDGFIYIKIFLHVDNKQSQERRACGVSPELLQTYKEEYFEDNSHLDFVFALLSCAIEDTLSFNKIDPIKFSKIFIPVFVNIFEIVIIESTDIKDEQVIRGFSFYLLREVFDEIMLRIAEDILFNFSNQNKKAIEFLSYLSVNEKIDSKGVRYKPRPILDESNHAWNLTTIRSTMIQHKKAKQAFYDKKNRLIVIKKKLDEYIFDIVELEQGQKSEEFKLKEIDDKINDIKKTLRKLDEDNASKVRYVDDGEEKIYGKKPLIVKLFKKEDLLLSEKSLLKKKIDQLLLGIKNKQKDVMIWQKKYSDDEHILEIIEKKGHPTDGVYTRIKHALAKTLTKR